MQSDESILQLVIMAGQSNMVGYGTKTDDLAPKWQKPLDNCFLWKNQGWAPLQAGHLNQRSAFGPELSFAHRFSLTTDAPIGIVKVSHNATYLSTHWSPEMRGGLFDQLVNEIRAAMLDRPVQLRGFIWMQGEADSINLEDATAYKSRFTAFVNKLRVAIGAPSLPVVAGVVNPPLKQCPHAALVRSALRTNKIENYASVSTDDLGLKADNLHFTAPGLSKLGNRLAKRLMQIEDPDAKPRIQQWLWNSDQYQCWYVMDTSKPDSAIISFPFAVIDSGYDEHAFGQVYFEKEGKNAVFIRSNKSLWFQREEVFSIADMIKNSFPKHTKFIHYGASMGAYAALLLSKKIKPELVIAIAPQYSIDRKVVPWETRWSRSAKRIGNFSYKLENHINKKTKKLVLYDGLSLDRKQIALLPHDKSWTYVNLPFASHQVLRFLNETGVLGHLLNKVPQAMPDVDFIRKYSRKNRQKSAIYWMTLAAKARARRPIVAKFAFQKAIENGGPPRKIQRKLNEIDEEL